MVCSLVEGKDKILNLTLDGLQKHVRKKKTLISNPRILVGESYINNDSQHQIRLMLAGVQIIIELVVNGKKAGKRKKFI